MSTFDDCWADATSGGGDFGDDVKVDPIPGGYVGTVTDSKLFTSKAGERTLVVEYETEDKHYKWADVRALTVDGEPQQGRIKAAKVLLANLNVNVNDVANLANNVAKVKGSRVVLEVVATDYTRRDGSTVLNTNVIDCTAPVIADDTQDFAPAEPSWT